MSRLRGIFLMLICAVVVSTAVAQERTTLPDSLSVGYRHIDAVKELSIRRDTAKARRMWSEIIEKDSAYAPALFYLSITDRNREQSLRYAHRAFASDSTNKWYTANYAEQLVSAGKYTRAIPIFRRLMRIDPTNIRSYHALAVIYGYNGMPYSAISILDSAELRIGYNYYLADIKQELLLSTHQYDRAVVEGKRRIDEHPYDIEAITKLADIYAVAGRDSLARATYERAFKLDTTNVQTIVAIADYYSRLGNTTRMLDYEQHLFRSDKLDIDTKMHRLSQYTVDMNFYAANYHRVGGIIRQMAIEYPNNRDVRGVYAQHLIYGGDHGQALEYLLHHLEGYDVQPADFLLVIQLEHYLGLNDQMNRDMARALELFPHDTDLLSLYSYICSERGDYKSAISVLEWALVGVKDDLQRSSLMGNIGDMYHEMGDDKSAFRYYKRALALNEDNALVLNNYAYFLSLLDKNLDEALVMAERAVSLQPNNASYADTYAWVLHRLGRNEEAKRAMRQALTLSSQMDASLLMHYADILWALGETFMAETYWQKAVERGYDKGLMESHIKDIKSQK
ncbi:MAG: tetratricopeptide repeat protein [Alistipes sp.]|nr:tetratricopeptide repeat protein [Alistipes sp.]